MQVLDGKTKESNEFLPYVEVSGAELAPTIRVETTKPILKETPISYCENTFPQTTTEFKRLQQIQYDTFCRKQMDYGPNNIALGTRLEKPEEKLASLTGIIIRINDKVQRLVNLLLINRRNPENESTLDSFMDLSVYAIIALIVNNGKWGK